MPHYVDITFDCLPLRCVGRLDIPIDASPKYRKRCESIKVALDKHGSHNTYYLYNAQCTFRLLNHERDGRIQFRFEGTLLTNQDDSETLRSDLDVELKSETCQWLTEPAVNWLSESVSQAVVVEFDRYIAAGDLQKTAERIEKIRAESDQSGGFVGMYL
jgi:hypothetical protein